MGNLCSSCFKGDASEVLTPDITARRKLQEDAAKRRQEENERRGIKDLDKVKKQQKRAVEQERQEIEATKYGTGQSSLRWQTNN